MSPMPYWCSRCGANRVPKLGWCDECVLAADNDEPLPAVRALPTPTEKHKESMLHVLRNAIERVEKGELTAVIVFGDIAGSTKFFTNYNNAMPNYLELIGKLEDLKFTILKARNK